MSFDFECGELPPEAHDWRDAASKSHQGQPQPRGVVRIPDGTDAGEAPAHA